MNLFATSENANRDLVSLLAFANDILEEGDPDSRSSQARTLLHDAPARLVEQIRAGAVPPVALEALAGVTGIMFPKDYGGIPVWKAAWELLRPAADEPSVDELQDSPKAAYSRAILRGDPRWYGSVARAAPIGAGGQSRDQLRVSRRVLFINQEAGLPWRALCAAYDTIGAGSHAGLDRLRALADAHLDSPSLAWLDEVTSWAAGDDARVTRCRERLRGLLTGGALGDCASALVSVVRVARKQLGGQMTQIRDAWQSVSACTRPSRSEERAAQREEVQALVERLRQREKHELAGSILRDPAIDEIDADEQLEEEVSGPFCALGSVPGELGQSIDTLSHYMVLGYRQTYGLELLRESLGAVQRWLTRDMPIA